MDVQPIPADALAALDRIATDAYMRTGGDTYGTEPPPVDSPPVADATPAPEPTDGASPLTTPESEPTSEPTLVVTGELAKKYKTPEELTRGYFEAVRMGNEAKVRLDSVAQAAAPGPTPVEVDPLDDIENYGVPKELIARGMRKAAREALTEYFAPALQATQADKQIVEKYPEYQEKFSEIERFAQSSPEVWAQVESLNQAGQQFAARQIAYLNWKVAESTKAATTVVAADTARKTEAKDARRDAGVGATRRADTRTAPVEKERTPEEEKRLLDLYKAGHPQPYLRSKLDGLLGPDFDNVSAQILG
jgi:hypothetical protein